MPVTSGFAKNSNKYLKKTTDNERGENILPESFCEENYSRHYKNGSMHYMNIKSTKILKELFLKIK